jgi:hypothetical protein
MVYDLEGLAKNIPINGKYYTSRTIRKRAEQNQLPSYIKVYHFKCGWIFEIQEIPDHLKGFIIQIKPKIKPR